MSTTIKDVAERAGLSVATVSRYINDNGYVGEKSKEKIALAIKELNYIPNEVARSLYKKTSKLVGLLVPEIDNPFFASVINGLESECKKAGYQLIISNAPSQGDIKSYVDSLLMNNIAGIVSSLPVKNIHDISCPIVGVDRSQEDFDYAVYFNDYEGGQMIAEALLDRSPKNILINAGPQYIGVAVSRKKGMTDVFDSKNIKYDVYESSAYDFNAAMDLVDFVDSSDKEYDTIIACNDIHALALSNYLQRKMVRVPDDVQIIGYDDTIFSKLANPKLATINHDGTDLGQIAGKMVLDLINKVEIEKDKIELRSYLVENESLRKKNI